MRCAALPIFHKMSAPIPPPLHLSHDLLEEIAGSLPESAPVNDRNNRRATLRAPVNIPAVLMPINGAAFGQPVNIVIQNISAQGVGFSQGAPFRHGQQFALRLPRRDHAPIWVVCTAARYQLVSADSVFIGATFTRMLDLRPRPCEPVQPPAITPSDPHASDINAVRDAILS